MGSAASTSKGAEDQGIVQLERRLQASGDLPFLQRAFSHLSASGSGSMSHSIPSMTLQDCFSLMPLKTRADSTVLVFISQLGPAISHNFFRTPSGQVDWPLFVTGFDRCCKQGLGADRLKSLLTLFGDGESNGPLPGLHLEENKDLVGFVTVDQVHDLLCLCWLMMCHARLRTSIKLAGSANSNEMDITLPDLRPLYNSFYAAATGSYPDKSTDVSSKEEILVERLCSWILTVIPGISECMAQYVQAQLQRLGSENNEVSLLSTRSAWQLQLGLLTSGTAWSIGLSSRDSSTKQLISAAYDLWGGSESYPSLIYRASNHGRGMNRFWTRVEGYKGPLLMLISATTKDGDESESVSKRKKWIVGALIPGGLDNKENFYGSSGCCLFAVAPNFLPLRSTGRETNYVYSYKKTPGTIYRSHPIPEGVGFGGSMGRERLWLDADFAFLTVHHHAVDKTYHSGALVPGQGYAAVQGEVGEVEVWGLGGTDADEQQAKFQHRENLFAEQRRKVDLKSFGNWQDSPEAAMMDMVSNPQKAAREER
ncbi:unnamed protein product [Sphagnum troendelagicum]|uniref:TLDc domain-containing protein n=1 Tax=Sphagnum troendelagicum TaxID=128251 RepID=A0ABP0U0R7_9BRYO